MAGICVYRKTNVTVKTKGDLMYLTRHQSLDGPRWALDGQYLPVDFSLSLLLQVPASSVASLLNSLPSGPEADGPLLAPVDAIQDVWAAGVTYMRSRVAREHESATADIYERVYDAERPEIFPKAIGWRACGPEDLIRVRKDSHWDVPEPELVAVINQDLEIVGYTAGNDVSSRAIEGENPLYLPQAKVFDGSCALGPGIVLTESTAVNDVPITLDISRNGSSVFGGESGTGQMKRTPQELAQYLGREMHFPYGALLMTGTGIVPDDDFTLQPGDVVTITVGDLTLTNTVSS
jgi:2-dehydro-3-deoxy-D-arabinonate dehydratase